MIYLFDKLEQLVKVVDETVLIDWRHILQVNQFERATFELPADFDLSGIDYFGFFDDEQVFKMFRITSRETDDVLVVEGMDKAESDLRTIGIIQDKRPTNVTAEQALYTALEGTGYQVGKVTGLPTVLSTSFYFISPAEALVKIIEKWQCEFRIRYTFQQNKIIGRYVDLAKRFGKVSGKQFVYGDNALSVVYEESKDEVVTALIGRGKGEQVGEAGEVMANGSVRENDAFGRRIDFSDVVWSTSKGNPVNKPQGQNYLLLESARPNYGLSQNGELKHRWAVWIDEEVEDPEILIERTWEQLQRMAVPATIFKANLVDMDGQAGYGDSVAVIRDEIGIAFSARIHKLVIDKLNASRSTVELGDYETLKLNKTTSNPINKAIHEQSLYAQQLTAFYQQLEEQIALKNAEIDEQMRLARDEWDTALEQATSEAEEVYESIRSEVADVRSQGQVLKDDLLGSFAELEDQTDQIRADALQAVEDAKKEAQDRYDDVAGRVADVEDKTDDLAKGVKKADQNASDALKKANASTNLANEAKQAAEQAKTTAANAGSQALKKANDVDKSVTRLKTELASTAQKIEWLSVGSANLLLNTATLPSGNGSHGTWRSASGGNGVARIVELSGMPSVSYEKGIRVENNTQGNKDIAQNVMLTVGDTYTISTWARLSETSTQGTVNLLMRAWNGRNHTNKVLQTPITHTEWKRYSVTFTADSESNSIQFGQSGAGVIELCGFKLERGNVATDWTPAPEDLDMRFNQFESSVSGELTTLSGRYDEFEQEWGNHKQSYGQFTTIVTDTQETVQELETGLSTAEGNIATLQTDVNSIQNDITKASMPYKSLHQKTAELVSGIDGIKEKFENIRVGAVNYVRNSDFSKDGKEWSLYQSAPFGLNFNFQHSITNRHRTGIHFWYHNTDTSPWYGVQQRFDFKGLADEEITISCLVGKDGGQSGLRIALHYRRDGKVVDQKWHTIPNSDITNDYKKHQVTFKLPVEVDELNLMLLGENGKTSNLYVTNVQLERGNVATDWHPAEEDFRSEMAEYIRDSTRDFRQLKSTVEGEDGNPGLVSRVSTVEQTAGGLVKQFDETVEDSLAKKVSYNSSLITENAAEIEKRLTKTDLEEHLTDNQFTTLETLRTEAAGLITREITEVKGLIPKEAGGRNLFVQKNCSSGYLNVSGSISPQGAIVNEVTSDFIEVQESDRLVFQLWVTLPANGQAWNAWQFYNANKQPIGNRQVGKNAHVIAAGRRIERADLTVPKDAKFVRISARMYSDGLIKLERGTLATDWTPAPEDLVSSVEFNRVKETAQLYERVLGSENEAGVKSKLAQHIMTSELWQTEIRDASWDTRNYLRDGTFSQEWLHWVDNRRQSGLNVDFTHSSGNRKQKGVHLWGSSNNIYKGIEQSVFFTRFAGEKITLSALISRDGSPESSVRLGVHFIKDGEILAQQWKWLSPSEIKRGIYGRHSWTIILPVDVDSLKIMFQFEEGKEANYYFTEASLNISDRFIGYSDSVEEAQAVATQVTQLSDNWAVKTLTDSGTVLSQLNLNSGGVKIEGKLIHLNGQTLIDEGVIKSAMIESVDAGKIKTGYLDTKLIEAGSIDTNHLKAGIISADKLAVGLGGNLLYNPIFSNPINGLPHGWNSWSNSFATNVRFSNTTNEVKQWALQSYLHNEHMLRFECNGDSRATVTCMSSTVPVTPNVYYGGSSYLAVHRGKVKMVLRFQKNDNTYTDYSSEWVSTQYSMRNGLENAKRVFVKALAPSNAVSVRVIIWLEGTDNANNKIAFASRPMLEECTEHTTAPSAWQNAGVTSIHGGSIVTNSIKADRLIIDEGFINKLITNETWAEQLFAESAFTEKLKAVEIDAGKITSGTIDAKRIGAEVIEANHIKSGAITTEKIASGAITADLISAKSIDGTKISAVGLSADLIKGGMLTSKNSTLKFDMDNGYMLFENDNARIARNQSGYATQFLNFTNFFYNGDINKPNSGAVLGVNMANKINSETDEFTGFRAFRSTRDTDINFTQTVGKRADIVNRGYADNKNNFMTGWRLTTSDTGMAISPLANTNAKLASSTIMAGDFVIKLKNGGTASVSGLLRAIMNNLGMTAAKGWVVPER